jgi:hypothetical protein
MNRQTFEIRIVGDAVLPQTVKSSDLGALLANWEEAITRTIQGTIPIAFDDAEAVVSLVGVQEGSNRLTLAVLVVALPAVGLISSAIASRRFESIPYPAQKAIFEISKQAARRKRAVEIVPDEQFRIVEAIISDENPIPPPSPPKTSGTTTIAGLLLRVGGAKPRAEIRLADGEILYLDVASGMAKQLGDRLYEEVSIEGDATWTVHDWKMVEFKARRITAYRPGNLVAAFEQLAEASNGLWDGVDPDEYTRRLRDED